MKEMDPGVGPERLKGTFYVNSPGNRELPLSPLIPRHPD